MDDIYASMQVSDPKIAADLLLAAHVASVILANSVPTGEAGLKGASLNSVSRAVGHALWQGPFGLRDALVKQHPQFDVESPEEFKRRLKSAGADDQVLWGFLHAYS